MNGQGPHIAGFLVFSAALHAAFLLPGGRPETRSIGPAGRVMQVSMAYRAAAAIPPPSPAVDHLEASTHRAPRYAPPKRPASSGISSKTARHRPTNPLRGTARATPVTTQAAETSDPGTSAPPPAHTGSGHQSAEDHLRSTILRLVSSRFHYPVLARRKGMEGIVRLQVRIESDGRISRLQVQQTSGYPVLDQAALQSLQLASVPDAAQWMNGQAIDIIIPVEYRLVGG